MILPPSGADSARSRPDNGRASRPNDRVDVAVCGVAPGGSPLPSKTAGGGSDFGDVGTTPRGTSEPLPPSTVILTIPAELSNRIGDGDTELYDSEIRLLANGLLSYDTNDADPMDPNDQRNYCATDEDEAYAIVEQYAKDHPEHRELIFTTIAARFPYLVEELRETCGMEEVAK